MSDTQQTGRELFETGLRNQHAVENQAVSLLKRQIERLENFPELSERMQRHLVESETQAKRLEELLAQYGTSHSVVKDTMMSFVGNMAALGHTPAPDEVLKNNLANYAFEHFEIASYKSLILLAGFAGEGHAVPILKQSLGEEEAMAQWIDEHFDETIRTFVTRRAAGETAGR